MFLSLSPPTQSMNKIFKNRKKKVTVKMKNVSFYGKNQTDFSANLIENKLEAVNTCLIPC